MWSCACAQVPAADRGVVGRCDRLIADLIPQIGQRPSDPVIAPITVLLGHANDELLDLAPDPRSAWAATGFRAIELAGDKLAVPAQDSVWPHYGGQSRRVWLARRPRAWGVHSAWPSGCGFRGQIFVARQQLLVHRPRDVGQDPRPIHNGPLATTVHDA